MTEFIRRAIPDDAAALAVLDQLADDWPWPERRIAQACGDTVGQRVLMLELDGKPAAFVSFALVLDEGSIYRIAVHPAQRRRGLGGQLLDTALAQLRQQGASRCLLELRRGNQAAYALYRSRGFILDGERPAYYPGTEGREDALLMSLQW